MYTNISAFCVMSDCKIRDAIRRMNENRLGIILVVTENRHLLGTITDGDMRRAFLSKMEFENSVQSLLDRKEGTLYSKPLTALVGQNRDFYLKLLQEHSILHLPLLNKEGCVVGLITTDELLQETMPNLQAVIMAGGLGTRLYPLTEELPKPMLPVGERPLLEIIIEQLRSAGIQKVNVTTHHKPERIQNHFGNGEKFGVDISYVAEDKPLGTAGALSLVDGVEKTTLVINGDILTQVDFKAMFLFHKEYNADLTIAVRSFEFDVPYGVIECEGTKVCKVEEKPKKHFLVNAGIYLLEPKIREYIPSGKQYHMTDLIQRLVHENLNVVSFPIHEYWLDIGAHAEYEKAQKEVEKLNF